MYAIRPARARELSDLRTLERLAGERFREVGLGQIADHDPHSTEELEAARAAGGLWVADQDGEPAGLALVSELDGELHLDEVAVHPDHGRRGLGSRLVEFACALGARRGLAALTLTTFRDVPFNGPLYRKLGFEPVPEDQLSPGLEAVRRREREDGLDVMPREVLRRRFVGS